MFGRLVAALLALFLLAQPLGAAPAPALPPGTDAEVSVASQPAGSAIAGGGIAGETFFDVVGGAFRPVSSSGATWVGGDDCLLPTGTGQWVANVTLPSGSAIWELYIDYYNTSVSADSTATLASYPVDGGTSTKILTLTSLPGSTNPGSWYSFVRLTTSGVDVNDTTTRYELLWSGSTSQCLYGMQVGYVPPPFFGSFLPGLNK